MNNSDQCLTKMPDIWVVEQNGTVVCGVGMKLTRWQAQNKVENETFHETRSSWRARPATDEEINPPRWIEEECDD